MRRSFFGFVGLACLWPAAVACGDAGGGGSSFGNAAGSAGASGSAGTGGSSGGLGAGGAGAGSGLGEGCARDTYTGELVPLDMFVMLDRSGSMTLIDEGATQSRWDMITTAIRQFTMLPGTDGLGMGLGVFPTAPSAPPPLQCNTMVECAPYDSPCFNGQCLANAAQTDSCVATDYAVPRVGIGPLGQMAGQIDAAMTAESPDGGTPMDPALAGSIEYARGWAQQHPDHITIVVLATDGTPTGCNPNEVNTVAARAQLGATEGVRTFVIGIGEDLTTLNQIAQAGGTGQAVIVGTGSNAGAEFLNALNAIRGAVGCTYSIPVPPSGAPDPSRVNVAFTPDGGGETILPKRPNGCQGGAGWYYDDPSNPKQIILCPASCDEVEQIDGRVDVVLGCDSIVQ